MSFKYISILSILLLISSGLFGQQPDSFQAEFYTSPEGDLYWNIKLPVYISLSDTPDGPRQALIYQKQENQAFRFTIEGLNYLKTPWAVDKDTKDPAYPKQTVNFPVYVDGSPPVVSRQVLSDSQFTSRTNTYYGNNTRLLLSAHDKYSGTKGIYYALSDHNFLPYADSLSFDNQAVHSVKFYAVDNVGNVSKVQEKTFIIDTEPPETELSVENAELSPKNILAGNSKILLNASDNAAGAKAIYYSINDSQEQLYHSPITFYHNKTGDYHLKYYAIDNLGNRETEKVYSFYLDKSPPMVASRIIGDVYKIDNKTFFSGRTQLQLTGFDNMAGVATIRYSVDGQEYIDYEDKPIYLPVSQGYHTIKYFATDSTGNDSRNDRRIGEYSYKLETFYLDLTGPEISYEIKGPQFRNDSILFLSPQSTVQLSAKDPESGTDYLAFAYNNEQRERKYEQAITLTDIQHGTSHLEFIAYDNVTNRNVAGLDFFLDAKAPEIKVHFGSEIISNEDNTEIYPYYVSVFISAKDETSGIKIIRYSLNEQPKTDYSGIIRGFAKNTHYTLEITAEDLSGNIGTKRIQFRTN